MLKRFLKKYKVEILEAYLAAMICFICSSEMNMGWIGIAIVIGFANTYLLGPVEKALKFGNKADEDFLKVDHIKSIKNIAKALIICAALVGIYYLIDKYLFKVPGIEPITFGIMYKILDVALTKIKAYTILKKV